MKVEILDYYEKTKRVYINGVTIEYEKFQENEIYIHSIHSQLKQQGRGTDALKHFLEEHNKYDIYLFASSEHGTDATILDKWYKKLGFEPCLKKPLMQENMSVIFNVTHCKYSQKGKPGEV